MVSLFGALKTSDLRARYDLAIRAISLLIEGIRLNAFPGENDAKGLFEECMLKHQRDFDQPDFDPSQILVIAGAVLQTLQYYNQQAGAAQANTRRELQKMIVMLTKSLLKATRGNERTITSLHSFEQQVERAARLDDLKTVREGLEICLSAMQMESKRQVEESTALREIASSIVSDPSIAGSFDDQGEDGLTGLPNARAAQAELTELLHSEANSYAIALRLDTLNLFNARYGRKVGDEFILKTSQVMAQRIGEADRLYRWTGSTFLVIMKRDYTVGAVRSEIERLGTGIRDQTLMLNSQSVLVRISLSTMCFPISKYNDLESITTDINSFVYRVTQS